ncbi:MAG TPA: AsmA-like C-terminal region-containing protein [Stellaceae bacterium]|nr:AsmA-like C-terminal region-containing protein [Stellaceae bacterium]
MIRRVSSHLLRWLAGIVAGLALAAGFLVWRLSVGPISLDALTPYVARSIAQAESGLSARVDHTLLSLGPGATIDIVARGVHLARRDGGAELTLPEVVMNFSVKAALHGVAAPTRIAVGEPRLRLARAADGSFHLGFADAGSGWADALLHDLAAAPDGSGPWGYLSEVAIRGATLTVDDRALGLAWEARRVDATLFRSEHGVSGRLGLTAVEPGGVEADLRGAFDYRRREARLGMRLGFAQLRPALFAGAAPALAPLAAVDLPVSGELRLTLATAAWRITDASADLRLGAGSLVQAALEGGRLPIASGDLSADYDPAAGRVSVERLGLDLGGPRIEVTGTVDGLGDGMLAGGWPQALDVAGALQLHDVPADSLPRFWPERLSPHSRDWVTGHIHDGIVTEADAQFAGHVDLTQGVAKPVRVDRFAGTMTYRGLTVEYFKPLVPLRGVDGTATFNRAELDLVPSSGAVKGVRLAGGAAKLTKLDTDDEQIAIDFGIKGPVRDVLEVLDAKPLEYARALKIDPAEVSGEVDGQLHFALPLKHDLRLAMVDFGARATLSQVAIRQVLADRDLSAGDLRLNLDRSQLRLDGTALLDGVPATVSWTENFGKGGPRRRYRVETRLDDGARQRLGLVLPAGMATGTVGVDATYTRHSADRATASIALDLDDTALAVKQLDWKKPTGVPAKATVDLDLARDHIRAVRQAAITGGGLDARFAVALDDSGRVMRAEVPRLVAGATDVAGTLTRRGDGGWRVELRGRSFDAAGLMGDLGHDARDQQRQPPLAITAALDRLILGPKRQAHAVTAELRSDGIHWQALRIDALLPGKGTMTLRFGQPPGSRSFRLATTDFGALLRLFDISDNVQGGHVEVTGTAEDNGPRRVLRGKVDGGDYRIINAPALARLLSLASLSGIGALLSGQGIPFTRLTGEFTFADGRLEVKPLRAYGGALGIKVDGVYDLDRETLDARGTLVPAYTLNSVLGNIPLLGKLFTGGEGEGVFAANFRVAGPAAAPKVAVNPLSALAPGVLRKLFLFDAPEPTATEPVPKSGSDAPR